MVYLDIYDDGKAFWIAREYYWDSVESLTPKMTKKQISEAQALALNWLKQHPRDPEKSLDHIYYKPE